jgi:hypothetical protein
MKRILFCTLVLSILLLGCGKKNKVAETSTEPSPAEVAGTSLEGMGRYVASAIRDKDISRFMAVSLPREQIQPILSTLDKPEIGQTWDPKERAQVVSTLKELSDSVLFKNTRDRFALQFSTIIQGEGSVVRPDWTNLDFDSFNRLPDPDGLLFSVLEIRFHNGDNHHRLTINHLMMHDGKWVFASPSKLQIDKGPMPMKQIR